MPEVPNRGWFSAQNRTLPAEIPELSSFPLLEQKFLAKSYSHETSDYAIPRVWARGGSNPREYAEQISHSGWRRT